MVENEAMLLAMLVVGGNRYAVIEVLREGAKAQWTLELRVSIQRPCVRCLSAVDRSK